MCLTCQNHHDVQALAKRMAPRQRAVLITAAATSAPVQGLSGAPFPQSVNDLKAISLHEAIRGQQQFAAYDTMTRSKE